MTLEWSKFQTFCFWLIQILGKSAIWIDKKKITYLCCDYGPFVELFHSGFTPQSFWFNQGSLAFPNITFFYCFFIFWYGFCHGLAFIMEVLLLFFFVFEEIATVIRRILATFYFSLRYSERHTGWFFKNLSHFTQIPKKCSGRPKSFHK